MTKRYESLSDMPKSRRVATRIIMGVWLFLLVLVLVFIIALFT